MSLPEKILMRKIKKRERVRQTLLQEKQNEDWERDKVDERAALSLANCNDQKESDTERTDKSPPVKREKKEDDINLNERHNGIEESDCISDSEKEIGKGNSKELIKSNGEFNDRSFTTLSEKICDKTLKAIAEMKFTQMTEIQAKSLPHLLEWRNLVGIAKTGSGKTLAFLIPVIELVYRLRFKSRNGTGAIIISPTRELALQTFGVLVKLLEYHSQTCALVVGGGRRKIEADKLSDGKTIVVATPGRLLDHLQNNPNFKVRSLFSLVIDEADRILDMGFEADMRKIIDLLPKQMRHTMLFSATKNNKTDELIRLAVGTNPVLITVGDQDQHSTPAGLQQGYTVVPNSKRFPLLFTFLTLLLGQNKKIIVFLSSCDSVRFHHDLFNFIDLPVAHIHGKMKQQQRTRTLFKFCNATSGILLSTDIIARGVDIPIVDWIVQYDPPSDANEYIHRVGRTARGESNGNAILFLRPEEINFLGYMKMANIPLNEMTPESDMIVDLRKGLEKIIGKNYHLNWLSKLAFKSYMRAYHSHHLKRVFDINSLDIYKVSLDFGLRTPPQVDLNNKDEQTNARKHKFGFKVKKYQKSVNSGKPLDNCQNNFKKTSYRR